jgi:hypothetical protein
MANTGTSNVEPSDSTACVTSSLVLFIFTLRYFHEDVTYAVLFTAMVSMKHLSRFR